VGFVAESWSGEKDVAALCRRIAELEAENRRLRDLLGLEDPDRAGPVEAWEPTLFAGGTSLGSSVTQRSTPDEKVALFRAVFRGREDVHALHWENSRTGKAGWGPAVKGGWANTRKPDREHLPLTDEVVVDHLAGSIHLGFYPLLRDDTSRLLVCDFDGAVLVLATMYSERARAYANLGFRAPKRAAALR
jgi:hypothetical protein